MIKNKQEQELASLTKEFETKTKDVNKAMEKIKQKEKSIELLNLDILNLNTGLNILETELINILKKRQRLNKKLFGVKDA